ncbi:ABC transporter permease subunit [Herbiconiux moechotypicola]|uniref:ABC transporter permease subunit n=1 Tax=Herbiconiux moechotypicola TaxID=637393 RepID=A0ABN3E512_9MICO|nr:ABC transporter permease subunit [Herbiconiux moechotypicola]MCS5731793.1 ABC transporter permease subunit [Herbiconiux moechotypicola]
MTQSLSVAAARTTGGLFGRVGGAVGRFLLVVLQRYWPIILLLIAWPVWLWANGYSRAVAPSPLDVATDLVLHPDVYVWPVLWTTLFAVGGLALGMLVGVVLGVLVWMSPLASGLLMPSALILRVVPVTAMIPILARLFGYGSGTVVVIVVILVFFPAFSLTVSGMSSVAKSSRDLFGVLGAGLLTRVLRLHLPAAIPSIMLALRLSAPIAILGVLLAEYLISGVGLGDLLRSSADRLQFEREWASALVATALSVLCFGLAQSLERRVVDRVT